MRVHTTRGQNLCRVAGERRSSQFMLPKAWHVRFLQEFKGCNIYRSTTVKLTFRDVVLSENTWGGAGSSRFPDIIHGLGVCRVRMRIRASLQLISSSVETCSLPDSRKLASVFLHVFWQSNLQCNVKCACTNTAAAQRNTSARGVASCYSGKCYRVAACTWNSKKSDRESSSTFVLTVKCLRLPRASAQAQVCGTPRQ